MTNGKYILIFMTVFFFIMTILMSSLYFSKSSKVCLDKEIYADILWDGQLASNQRKFFRDDIIEVEKNGVKYKIINPEKGMSFLSGGDSLDSAYQKCPSGTYGPLCQYKYCPWDFSKGFYNFEEANKNCKSKTGYGCNPESGECSAE